MSDIMETEKRTIDPAARYLLKKSGELNIETGWDRFNAMQDACGFGELGLCCRHCMNGPCRIDPFGEGPQKGICGISADGIVARNLCRMVATGASAHSDHGAHILEVLELIAKGESPDFKIKDPGKMKNLLHQLGVDTKNLDTAEQINQLVKYAKEAYSNMHQKSHWLERVIPKHRYEKLDSFNLLPTGIDPVIRETLHRTHIGVDADPMNLLLGSLKCSLSDFLGMDVSTNLSDIILGTPELVYSSANLGVFDKDAVNIAVHGHNPLISESILEAAPRFKEKAIKAGASKGINIVGVCCTGNEVLMRHGVPLATNASSQELALLTGAVEAMVVDVQCIWPSLGSLCECYHTELITTVPISKIPGAVHQEFNPEKAAQSAGKILEMAVEAFKKRDPKKVDIPNIKKESLVGFTPEGVVGLLAKLNADDPLQPLIDQIVSGNIYGVVLFAGCNNYKVTQDASIIGIAEKLAADNILMLATGCAAGGFAKAGLLSPTATEELCGEELREVLTLLGNTAGLKRPLPPVWHMGSCVDNTRAARLAFALANKLDVDTDKLPIVASAPEAMSEKSVAIGTWAVAIGLTTHLGVIPPVMGGKKVTQILTETAKDLIGSHFIVETSPQAAYLKIKEVITEKRIALGLKV